MLEIVARSAVENVESALAPGGDSRRGAGSAAQVLKAIRPAFASDPVFPPETIVATANHDVDTSGSPRSKGKPAESSDGPSFFLLWVVCGDLESSLGFQRERKREKPTAIDGPADSSKRDVPDGSRSMRPRGRTDGSPKVRGERNDRQLSPESRVCLSVRALRLPSNHKKAAPRRSNPSLPSFRSATKSEGYKNGSPT